MKTATASTDVRDAGEASRVVAEQIRQKLGDDPGAVVLFAAPNYDHAQLLHCLNREFPSTIMVGASSAGEFTDERLALNSLSILALGGDDVEFGSGATRSCPMRSSLSR